MTEQLTREINLLQNEIEAKDRRIAELEVGVRRLIDASTLKSQEKAMVELDELTKEQEDE